MDRRAHFKNKAAFDERRAEDRVVFGFWVYLMTDLLMFAVLFAAYAVLQGNTFGGPSGKELFDLPFVLTETLILLTSSFTCGLAMLGTRARSVRQTLVWFSTTFALGITFLAMELNEFSHLIADGHGPQRSAFLSAYFTLVGTHGLHIAVGLLWMFVAMVHIASRGLTPFVVSRLTRFALFWHFLDIVWIFIFTIVYLLGLV